MPRKWQCPAYLHTCNLLLIPSCSTGQGHHAAAQGAAGLTQARQRLGCLLSTGDRLCRQGQMPSVCLYMLYRCCPHWPALELPAWVVAEPMSTHGWEGLPRDLAPSLWELLTSPRASLLLIPSISPQQQQCPQGWAVGRQAAAGSGAALRTHLPVVVLPTHPAEGATPDSWLFCSIFSQWANWRLGMTGML